VAGETRSARIVFRVTPRERDQIKALAKENDSTLGEWCRFGALAQAAECVDPDEPPIIVLGGAALCFCSGDSQPGCPPVR
jgi:hypothetical protein